MNKFIVLISLCLLAGVIVASPLDHFTSLWSAWKVRNNKAYTGAENKARYAIFVENVKKIIKNNAEKNGVTFAINKFADLTASEFKSTVTKGLKIQRNTNRKTVAIQRTGPVPNDVDWRQKGAVTPVKDQGQCGSCWAFSATGALEGLYFNDNQKLLSFSEQLFVDCVEDDDGCDGGWMDDAFQYAADNGVETEEDYPYKARDQTCRYDKSKALRISKGFFDVPENNATQLKAAIEKGPTSVAIEADQLVFQFYKTGVILAGCGADLDHGVLAVGYQQTALGEAYIVKNSWGKSWGNNGYVLIGTNPEANKGQGVCGILAAASYPTN